MFRRFMATAAIALVAIGGCSYEPDLPDPDPPEVAMNGFSWVIDHALAGMPHPGSRATVEQDLTFLEHQDIDLLVSLTEDGTDPVAAAAHGITVLHIPVKDFTAPTQAQLATFTAAADTAMASGRTVGVHCGAGYGRTGTFLAAYFVAHGNGGNGNGNGMSADEAIAHVRALRPGSIETSAQEQAVRDYAQSLRHERATAPPPTEL